MNWTATSRANCGKFESECRALICVAAHRVKAGAGEFFASIEDREAGFDRYPEYVRE